MLKGQLSKVPEGQLGSCVGSKTSLGHGTLES